MTVIPSVSPVAPSQPSVISMPWKNSSGVSSASSLATGTGQRAAYGQRLQNANVPKPTGNPRAGEGRLQVEADAKTTQPVASVMPVSSQSNRRWVVYLPQQRNLGKPSRSAHGPKHSACRQARMATCGRVCAQLRHENAHSELLAVAIC